MIKFLFIKFIKILIKKMNTFKFKFIICLLITMWFFISLRLGIAQNAIVNSFIGWNVMISLLLMIMMWFVVLYALIDFLENKNRKIIC